MGEILRESHVSQLDSVCLNAFRLFVIVDTNDAPSDISLSASVVSEDANKGTVIGQFATVDQDNAQSHIYALINTIDNLAINGDKLVVSGKLNFETEPLILITVQVTDSGSPVLTFQKSFNITINDANDAPSAISVTIYPVPENNTVDRIVANVKVIDEDVSQTHTCSVIGNPADFFTQVDTVSHNITVYIKGTVSLDFETSQSIIDTIRCYDSGVPSLFVDQQITIPVLDSNERPTRLLISGADVVMLPENSPNDAVVGQLSCTDQDAGQSHTYTLETNTDVFKIDAELLRVKNNSKLNYEELPGNKRIPIKVTVTDNGSPSLSLTASLQVEITDVNEAPSNVRMIHAIGSEVAENTTIGTHIGELFCDNPEGFRQLISYELLNWNDVFVVTESHGPAKVSYLTLKGELDFAKQSQYNITVKGTDNGSPPLSAQAVITIQVGRSDPCFTGELNCGGEVCQRVNKTRGNCGCLAGFKLTGNRCVEIDDCKPNCQYCDNPVQACAAKKPCLPCQNNGVCTDKHLGYTCSCPPGFSDQRCETNIDDCALNQCQFGTCFDLVNNYRCECIEGYEGRNCSVNINECAKKECLRGDCKDLVAGFSCTCEMGVDGLLCNRKLTDCNPNPCTEKKQRCVPPAYADAKMASGFKESLCAGDEHVSELTFNNVPEDKDQLNKWKYIFRQFITTMVGIPFGDVGLSEDLSNGGIYYPTDVVMYPMKPSRRKRDTTMKQSFILPIVLRVKNKLVTENSTLIAVNKTCATIPQTSIYFVYCNATYSRMAALGLTTGADGQNGKGKVNRSTGKGPTFFTPNNIYIIAGSAAGFLLLVAIAVMCRAKTGKYVVPRERLYDDGPLRASATESSYFDAVERQLVKRIEDSYMDSIDNPLYGDGDTEVERDQRMFDNPLFGISHSNVDDADDDYDGGSMTPQIDIEEDGGIVNPTYGRVADLKAQPGDTDC
eukprot:gene3137-3605_t